MISPALSSSLPNHHPFPLGAYALVILLSMSSNALEETYSKICKIGSGSYGTVYLYERRKGYHSSFLQELFRGDRHSESDFVAVKLYKKPNNNRQGIDFSCLREINCLQGLSHRNIVACNEIIYLHRPEGTAQQHQVYVVMDYHLQLSDLLKAHSSYEDKKRIAKQIVLGLKYLHDNYIFHRDMKPENLFVSRTGWIRIADFGFAKEFGTPYKKFTINACTIEYRAPEIFLGTHYYTEMSDIWSLGCVLAYIFTGRSLFRSENKSQIELLSEIFYLAGTPDEANWAQCMKMPVKFKCAHEQQKNFAEELNVPADVGSIISQCMKIDPTRRLNTSELLAHPFFSDVSDQPFDVSDLYEAKVKNLTNKYA